MKNRLSQHSEDQEAPDADSPGPCRMKVSSNLCLPHKLKILLALICLHGSLSASQIDPAIELQYRQDREAWMRSEQSPLAWRGFSG